MSTPEASSGSMDSRVENQAPSATSVEREGGDWTPQRLRILGWLTAEAPTVAPVYEGAVRIAMDQQFPGRVWFVAHALRDMRNRLPDAISGPIEASRTQYSKLASAVTEQWLADGLPSDGTSPVSSPAEPDATGLTRLEVSLGLIDVVGHLVAGHLEIKPRKAASARRLLEAVSGGPVPSYAVQGWLDATNRVEKFAHVRNEPLADEEEHEFDEVLASCERALLTMANRSFDNMDEIDKILDAANR